MLQILQLKAFLRDEPGRRAGSVRQPLPGGSLVPAQCLSHHGPASQTAQTGHSPAGQMVRGKIRQEAGETH